MKLEVSGLTVRYGEGSNALTALAGVDLALSAGQTLGIVGESGSGKSTLARAVVGLVGTVGGSVRLDGEDYTPASRRNSADFRRRVQMVFQDPYGSLDPRMTIGQMLVEVLRTHNLVPRADRRTEAIRLLRMVGLAERDLSRYPHQFSGGQRQRIAIARALCVRPEVVINDEVTSALDVSAQATVLNLLKALQRELALSYVFISHDLSTVRYMSDVIAVMYLGSVVELAATDELFADPQHPYTKALIDSLPKFGVPRSYAPMAGDPPNPRNPPRGCRFHPRCPVGPLADLGRTICAEVDPRDVADGRLHHAACHFARERDAHLLSAVDSSPNGTISGI